MNYEAERAMNQKRLRMEAEPGHGVVQGNGLPLNYIDNGHQIPYQPYAGAYNTHYPPPDAFAAYGPPPPGGYAPQNLSYAPPAHQNYPHHQSFPPQQPQAQLHMAQTHMVQGYGDVHKAAAAAAAAAAWGPQPHLLPPSALDAKPPLPEHKPKEIKLEPPDAQKRPHAEADLMSGELEQPKIKIKTDIFKPDELAPRPEPAPVPREIPIKPLECAQKPVELQKDEGIPISAEGKPMDKPLEASKPEAAVGGDALIAKEPSANADKSQENAKGFSSPESKTGSSPGKSTPGSEHKKRGRPKGSTNKPKPPGTKPPAPGPRGPPPPRPAAPPRPRAMGYQYAMRPFRKDFSGIQFRRRWSDDCLDSSHIPNEVYFGDVPVTPEVLHNYYDANAERERLAAHAAHLAAQKAAAAKLAQAKLQARGITQEVTTVDSSSSEDSSGSDEESEDSDEDAPLKKSPATPKPKAAKKPPATPGKRGRPPVPPELRQPGITDMKKFCKAAGIRFDYKKLVEGCTKNKERVAKMMELLTAAGLEGKPSLEACRALKTAKLAKKDQEKQAKKDAKAKHKEDARTPAAGDAPRRMTRGATGVKPRQRIVISSDEEDGTPLARRTLSKLRSSVRDDSDSD